MKRTNYRALKILFVIEKKEFYEDLLLIFKKVQKSFNVRFGLWFIIHVQ